jgi:hypothetical protein
MKVFATYIVISITTLLSICISLIISLSNCEPKLDKSSRKAFEKYVEDKKKFEDIASLNSLLFMISAFGVGVMLSSIKKITSNLKEYKFSIDKLNAIQNEKELIDIRRRELIDVKRLIEKRKYKKFSNLDNKLSRVEI